MERLRDRGDVPALLHMLDRHDWLIPREGPPIDLEVQRRVAAVNALAALESREAEEGIIHALGDRDPRVLVAAVDALGPAPSRPAAQALARAAATWRAPVLQAPRAAAIALLIELRDELYAVEYTQTLIDDQTVESLPPDDERAVRDLFAADSGPVAEIFATELTKKLASPDERERSIASRTLTAMGRVAIGPLISTLDDSDRRVPAAVTLGHLREAEAVAPLVEVLASRDPAAREAAARALGEIRHPGALDALVHASADPVAEVRDAAQDALDRMQSVLVAMLGASGVGAERSRDQIGPPEGRRELYGPPSPAPGLPPSSLLRRVLRRPENEH